MAGSGPGRRGTAGVAGTARAAGTGTSGRCTTGGQASGVTPASRQARWFHSAVVSPVMPSTHSKKQPSVTFWKLSTILCFLTTRHRLARLIRPFSSYIMAQFVPVILPPLGGLKSRLVVGSRGWGSTNPKTAENPKRFLRLRASRTWHIPHPGTHPPTHSKYNSSLWGSLGSHVSK